MYVCMYHERRGVQYVVGVLCWGMLSTHHDLVLYEGYRKISFCRSFSSILANVRDKHLGPAFSPLQFAGWI